MSSLTAAVFLFCIALPQLSHAQVAITEIMYDLKSGSDAGREWVEVYNASTSSVAVTELRLFENGTNHKIIAFSGEDTLPSGSYAVIASSPATFKTDWPDFSGTLFDSAFSFSNTGETIALRDTSLTIIDSVSYQGLWGASGDGNSLNRAPSGSGPFVPRMPSPGATMSATAVPPPPPKQAAVLPKSAPVRPLSVQKPSEQPGVEEVAPPASEPDAQTAAAAEVRTTSGTSTPSHVWWLAAIALALTAGIALIAARHVGKGEWDIVEDKG